MRCTLRTVPISESLWHQLDALPGRSVFCRSDWLGYLAASQRAEPVVARVRLDGRGVGWFTGAVVRRGGLRFLGSPLPGWGTSYMGFAWDDPEDAVLLSVALAATRRWALGTMGCAHLEVLCRADPSTVELPGGVTASTFHSYRRTLVDDATMLSAMSTNARRNLRRAQRHGLRVEVVESGGAAGFATQYYEQARHAFARRGTRPSYGEARVLQLIEHLHPGGHLLLLRARTESGQVAATGISAGVPGGTAVFLMGAADPELLGDRPNEAVMWAAMRNWRDRGAEVFDFGGGGVYKEKFGCDPCESLWVRSSILPGAEPARAAVQRVEGWARRRDVR